MRSVQRFTDDPIHDPYVFISVASPRSAYIPWGLQFSYCATKGLLWSHMGWIFFKPKYERMSLIDHDDLDNDPGVYRVSVCVKQWPSPPPQLSDSSTNIIVREHLMLTCCHCSLLRHIVLLALVTGFVVPAMLGSLWGDAMGSFIWGGLLARVMSKWATPWLSILVAQISPLAWHCTFFVNSYVIASLRRCISQWIVLF